MITREEIVKDLKQMGLKAGMAVEVHSSLSSMGYVQNGPATVIQALIDVVGKGGALIMSAYPVTLPIWPTEEEKAKGIICKVRFMDENDNSKTGMGAISDAFRRWPGTCLGKGMHRVCAWGKDARLHAQGYDYLLSIDGWVLLIGVDIHSCSAMHIAETKVSLPQDIKDYFELPEDIRHQYPPKKWHIQYHDPPEDGWEKIQEEAVRRGLIVQAKIGQAKCFFFRAKPVVDIYEERLRADPHGLLGLKSCPY
jgi:aminoglycoside N3'-acetyltransferase